MTHLGGNESWRIEPYRKLFKNDFGREVLSSLVLTNGPTIGMFTLSANYLSVSGGDTHESVELRLVGDKKLPSSLFAKLGSGAGVDVLKTEFESLKLINNLVPSLYPQALLFDENDAEAVLVMLFHDLELLGHRHAADAGRVLAEQHKKTFDQFGWHSDNYIGMTPQPNQWMDSGWFFFKSNAYFLCWLGRSGLAYLVLVLQK